MLPPCASIRRWHTDANTHSQSDVNTDRYGHGDRNRDTDANCDSNTYSHINAITYCYSQTHSNAAISADTAVAPNAKTPAVANALSLHSGIGLRVDR